MDEFDLAPQAEEEAIPAGLKLNFGRLTIKPRFLHWVDRQPQEVNAQTYQALQPKERSLEYVFAIDIQEFNPALKFTYERKVQVGGLDWNKVLKASLTKLLGDTHTTKKELPNTLRQLNGRYVCAEDVPQTPTSKNPDRSKYNTISILKVFESREKCYAEYAEIYKKDGPDSGSAPGAPAAKGPSIPIGYNADTWLKLKPELNALFLKYAAQMPAKVAARKTGEDYGATMENVIELLGLNVDEPAATTAPEVPPGGLAAIQAEQKRFDEMAARAHATAANALGK